MAVSYMPLSVADNSERLEAFNEMLKQPPTTYSSPAVIKVWAEELVARVGDKPELEILPMPEKPKNSNGEGVVDIDAQQKYDQAIDIRKANQKKLDTKHHWALMDREEKAVNYMSFLGAQGVERKTILAQFQEKPEFLEYLESVMDKRKITFPEINRTLTVAQGAPKASNG